MARKRKSRGKELKAKVALAVVSGFPPAQIASRFGVHPTQVATWKKQLVERAGELFVDGRRKESSDVNEQELYEQIGRLRELSIRRQCELLELERSTYYYELGKETAENLALMRLIDEE